MRKRVIKRLTPALIKSWEPCAEGEEWFRKAFGSRGLDLDDYHAGMKQLTRLSTEQLSALLTFGRGGCWVFFAVRSLKVHLQDVPWSKRHRAVPTISHDLFEGFKQLRALVRLQPGWRKRHDF